MALTAAISGHAVAERLRAANLGPVIEETDGWVTVAAENVVPVARFLRDDPELDCKYLNCLTAVDWIDYFEVVYHLSSLARNHALVLKARAARDTPIVPSVNGVWRGANLQEREAYDLMGISFSDHPGLKRIFLWEGFPGHPLRKDFLSLQGGYKPGLQRFPFEFPEGQRDYPTLRDTEMPTAPPVPRLDQPPPQPFPISGPETAARLAEHARETGAEPEQPQGAGTDPALAGGTAEDPDATTAAPRGGSTESEEAIRSGELRERPAPENEPPAGEAARGGPP